MSKCTNIIRIYYNGLTLAEKVKVSDAVKRHLEIGSTPVKYGYENKIVNEYYFHTEHVAPLTLLQMLSDTYNIGIKGVSYDFEDGYVEAYELESNLVNIEEPDSVFVNIEESNDSENKTEDVEKLPESQDTDIFDEFNDELKTNLEDIQP